MVKNGRGKHEKARIHALSFSIDPIDIFLTGKWPTHFRRADIAMQNNILADVAMQPIVLRTVLAI
jgi:hypothetical protein